MVHIDPIIWGASAWTLLHDISYIVASYDNDNIMEKAKEFFMLLKEILPCAKCRFMYHQHIMNLSFPTQREKLPRWVFDLHNRVNDTLPGKIKPNWKSWNKTYPTEMKKHTLQDIWPFVQSIMEIHPGKNKTDTDAELEIYSQNIVHFFSLLPILVNYENVDIFISDIDILKQVLQSKTTFRIWIMKKSRELNISSMKTKTKTCNNNTTCDLV